MLNLLLIENAANKQLLEESFSQVDYQLRKIHDYFSCVVHVKEFNPDIIIFNLTVISDEFISFVNNLGASVAVPIMVFTTECSTHQVNKLIEAEVSFLGIDGLPCTSINNLVDIAVARFKQLQDLKHAIDEARTQLEDRKQIDRAKAILIKTRNYNEDEAYHTLRKLAMGRNITLGEMARNVIAMADLLK